MDKISIIGAGRTGSTITQMLFELETVDLVLLDCTEGKALGVSLDILQSGPIVSKKTSLIGTSDFSNTKDSDIVIITTGKTRKEGMTRENLLSINAEIIKDVVAKAVKYSPNAIYLILTNPLDTMAYLAMKVGNIPKERIIGQSGVLDSARMQYFSSLEAPNAKKIECCVLGGHGDEMVPLTSMSMVDGVPFDKYFDKDMLSVIVDKTRSAGAEIIKLIKDGSAVYAPAAACVQIAQAILKDSNMVLPCSTYLTGEYGLNNIFFGVPVELNKTGVKKIIEYKLAQHESDLIKKSSESVKVSIQNLNKVINF